VINALNTFINRVYGPAGGGVYVPPPPRVAAPVFSPSAPGNFLVDTAITITSATPGATIRYTTNGVPPTSTTGIVYSGPVTLTALTTLQAIAYNGVIVDSTVVSAEYFFNVQMPTFSPPTGSYPVAQTVTIASPTDSDSIRYTTDGSDPTPTVGNIYTVPITVAVSTTVHAIAYKTGWNSSPIGVGNYVINDVVDFVLTSDNTLDFLTADSGVENLVTDLSPSSGPPFVGLWNYSTPPNATIPNAGEIIHGDNFLSKLNVSVLDVGGNVLDLAQITTGDTIEFNSFLYTVQAPVQMFSGYAAISIDPEVQQPDGAYTVTTNRP